jgi:hypothetical protein
MGRIGVFLDLFACTGTAAKSRMVHVWKGVAGMGGAALRISKPIVRIAAWIPVASPLYVARRILGLTHAFRFPMEVLVPRCPGNRLRMHTDRRCWLTAQQDRRSKSA